MDSELIKSDISVEKPVGLLDGSKKYGTVFFFWPVGWISDWPGLIYVWNPLLDRWMTKTKRDIVFENTPLDCWMGKKNGRVFYFWPVGWIQSWSSQTYVWKCLLDGWMGRKKTGVCFFLACWMVG